MTPESLHAWMEAAGGRRFLMASAAGIVSTVLFVFHQLTQGNYMMLQSGTVLMYLAANNHEKSMNVDRGAHG